MGETNQFGKTVSTGIYTSSVLNVGECSSVQLVISPPAPYGHDFVVLRRSHGRKGSVWGTWQPAAWISDLQVKIMSVSHSEHTTYQLLTRRKSHPEHDLGGV